MNPEKKRIFKRKAFKKLCILTWGILMVISNPHMLPAQRTLKKSTTSMKKIIRKDKPNILWITTEGLPLKVLSCYGGTLIKTPNIDRIAKEGMLFQNSFCTNGLCAPSRATLLTGKYSHLNGMLANPGDVTGVQENYFDAKQETFARILQQNRYKTGIVGKWHLKDKAGKASNTGETGFHYFVIKNGEGGPY